MLSMDRNAIRYYTGRRFADRHTDCRPASNDYFGELTQLHAMTFTGRDRPGSVHGWDGWISACLLPDRGALRYDI